MPTGSDDVRSLGKTGSERRAVKVTRLTQRGRRDWFRAAAAEASAMLCQWEWLALFVGGGGIELLEAPLS